MKLGYLTIFLLLATAIIASGQDAAQAEGSKSEPREIVLPDASPPPGGNPEHANDPVTWPDVSSGRPAERVTSKLLPQLRLQAGTLEQAIEELKKGLAADDLPTIVYATGVSELKIAAPLRLRGVRPIDALTLVTKAAGCELAPIFSIAPDGDGNKKLIGYRIVPEPSRSATFDPSAAGNPRGHVGVTLAIKNRRVVVDKVTPRSPAAQKGVQAGDQILAVAEEGGQKNDVSGMSEQRVAELIRGVPGSIVQLTLSSEKPAGSGSKIVYKTVSLERAVLASGEADLKASVYADKTGAPITLTRDPNTANLVPLRSIDPGFVAPGRSTGPMGVPQRTNGPSSLNSMNPFVKVYALGSILTEQDMKEKQNSLGELISISFEAAGLRAPLPHEAHGGKAAPKEATTLHFHPQSKTLIAKATAEEHRLIEQVLTALKENATEPAVF